MHDSVSCHLCKAAPGPVKLSPVITEVPRIHHHVSKPCCQVAAYAAFHKISLCLHPHIPRSHLVQARLPQLLHGHGQWLGGPRFVRETPHVHTQLPVQPLSLTAVKSARCTHWVGSYTMLQLLR
jgi:hypothetical protein